MVMELPPISRDDGRSVRLPEEVAASLGLCGNSIRRAIERGEVRATKVGVRTLIPLLEVRRLLGVDAVPEVMAAGPVC